MGLLDLLMPGTGVTKYIDQNHNFLSALGAGLGSGTDINSGLAKAAQFGPSGMALDKSQGLAANAINQTIQYLHSTGNDDLIPLASGGQGAAALQIATQRSKPVVVARNGALVSPAGSVLYQSPASGAPGGSQPADLQDYAFYSKQETAAGRTPASYMDFKQQSKTQAVDPMNDPIVQQNGDGIISGQLPPVLTGNSKYTPAIKAYLAKKGYNLTAANQDFTSTTKLLGTMNGAQQTRLRQAVNQVDESLNVVDQMAQQWKGNNWPVLNKVNLVAAANGAPGYTPEQQSLATQLVAEINDTTSELGTVYKGGNASTDESLKLAASQLSADWSEDTLRNAIKLAKTNVAMRKNSLNLATAGIANSQYNQSGQMPQTQIPAVGPAGITANPGAATKTLNGVTYTQGPDGQWYQP